MSRDSQHHTRCSRQDTGGSESRRRACTHRPGCHRQRCRWSRSACSRLQILRVRSVALVQAPVEEQGVAAAAAEAAAVEGAATPDVGTARPRSDTSTQPLPGPVCNPRRTAAERSRILRCTPLGGRKSSPPTARRSTPDSSLLREKSGHRTCWCIAGKTL